MNSGSSNMDENSSMTLGISSSTRVVKASGAGGISMDSGSLG